MTSTKQLVRRIEQFVADYNPKARPFAWVVLQIVSSTGFSDFSKTYQGYSISGLSALFRVMKLMQR